METQKGEEDEEDKRYRGWRLIICLLNVPEREERTNRAEANV